MLDVLEGAVAEGTGVEGLSPTLGTLVLDVALEAKKFLFTETDLKVMGFLTDEVLEWPMSSFLTWLSLEASVSDPPLMLTSAELTTSSTMSWTNLSTAAAEDSRFTSGPAWPSVEAFSVTLGLPSSFCVQGGKSTAMRQNVGYKKGGLRAKQQESQFLRRTVVA